MSKHKPPTPRLPKLKQEAAVMPTSAPDEYRQAIMNDDQLSISHARVYDYWQPRVGPPTAYRLAVVAFRSNPEYQRLRREVTQS